MIMKGASGSDRIEKIFYASLLAILLISFSSKCFMLAAHEKMLEAIDDVLGVKNWEVLSAACLVELLLICCILSKINVVLKSWITLWVALCFGIYRTFLHFGHFAKPCACLGKLPQLFHLPDSAISVIMWLIIAYMMAGAVFLVFRERDVLNIASGALRRVSKIINMFV
jgi:hypothetical protein